MTYYSQFGEDKWIHENVTLPVNGTFVDIGAGDGVTFSNTAFFERELGWTGVCYEPDQRSFQCLLRNRKCQSMMAAVGNRNEVGILTKESPMFCRVVKSDGNQLIPIHTPPAMYRVDLLSIDTEGMEIEILLAMEGRPRIIIAEFLNPHGEHRAVLENILLSKQYAIKHATTCNLIAVLV